jgi:hypothetical protein
MVGVVNLALTQCMLGMSCHIMTLLILCSLNASSESMHDFVHRQTCYAIRNPVFHAWTHAVW